MKGGPNLDTKPWGIPWQEWLHANGLSVGDLKRILGLWGRLFPKKINLNNSPYIILWLWMIDGFVTQTPSLHALQLSIISLVYLLNHRISLIKNENIAGDKKKIFTALLYLCHLIPQEELWEELSAKIQSMLVDYIYILSEEWLHTDYTTYISLQELKTISNIANKAFAKDYNNIREALNLLLEKIGKSPKNNNDDYEVVL
jgi:hypothetical protein